MLIIFLLVIVVGVVAFVLVLKKEMGSSSSLPPEEAHLRDFENQSPAAVSVKTVAEKLRALAGKSTPALKLEEKGREVVADGKETPDINAAQFQKLEQKCIKLEEILEEKNRHLARVEEDLKNELGHRNEFDGVKEILQQQIEEHKAQIKQLRQELSQSLEENLALQTRICDMEKAVKGHRATPFVATEPAVVTEGPVLASDPNPASPRLILNPNPSPVVGSGGVSLHDVFGEEPDKK